MKVTLRHETEITASTKTVFFFFEHIAKNYTTWHPDHINFRWITGDSLKAGVVAYVEHRIRGKIHTLDTRFTKLVPNQLIEFEWGNPNGSFYASRDVWLFENTSRGCRFVSECDLVLKDVSSLSKEVEKVLAAIRKHLAEEGENLKRLVELAEGRGNQ